MTAPNPVPENSSITRFPPNFPSGVASDAYLDYFKSLDAAAVRSLRAPSGEEGIDGELETWETGRTVVTTPTGFTLSAPPSGTAVDVLADLASTDAGKGASLVGYLAPYTGAVARTQAARNADDVYVSDFGPGGTADDTSDVAAAILAATGKRLHFVGGTTYTISTALVPNSNSSYYGNGCKIKVKSGTDLNYKGIFNGACDDVVITGFELDGNKGAAGSKAFGVKLTGGSRNSVVRNRIHDTYYSGMWLEGQIGFGIYGNALESNGVIGIADNHGIQIISVSGAAPAKDGVVYGNYVTGSQRKGIATYQATGGVVSNVIVAHNNVSSCLLGGIYIGSLAANGTQSGMIVSQNTVRNCYTNIELAVLRSFSVEGNTCTGSTDRSGITCTDLEDGSITGNSISDSATRGILLTIGDGTGNKNVSVTGNTVMRSNRSVDGFSGGINFDNTTYSLFEGNLVSDTVASPKQVMAISEGVASDFNIIRGNLLANASSALTLITGANTFLETTTGKVETVTETAVNVPRSPQAFLTLANGANNDVVVPVSGSNIYVGGPTGVFNITGLVPPTNSNGRKITIFNYTNFVMTISHDNAGSAAANRILIGGSADIAVAKYGCVEMTYFQASSTWVVTGGSRA